VAGHWRERLFESLNWRVFPEDLKVASTNPRPPSWSWLSVDSGIQFQTKIGLFRDYESLIKIEFVDVQKAPKVLPFGRVFKGCLSLKAPSGRAWWILSSQLSSHSSGQPKHRCSLMETKGSSTEVAIAFTDVMEKLPMNGSEVDLIPLGTRFGGPSVFGIVVERVSPSCDILLRRIGYFEGGPRSLLTQCSKARLLALI
jgi:hypothetical protein